MASDVLAHWLYYLELFRPYMKIKHQEGIKHGNVDALSRFETRSCPREDCPDPCHKLPKHKLSNLEDHAILHPVLTRNQMNAKQGLDSDCAVVHSCSDEEIKDAQYRDHDLSRFLKTLHEHTEKPHVKLLGREPSQVKIMCSLWKQFKTVDGILYRVGKTSVDPWRVVNPKINTN